MNQIKREPSLHGWDDEKVYWSDENGHEHCVSDQPALMARLMEICREFFQQNTEKAD